MAPPVAFTVKLSFVELKATLPTVNVNMPIATKTMAVNQGDRFFRRKFTENLLLIYT
ncbi:hypothetical protein SDC9_118970 [bioreactor metagenome]|uniref:Uncharacterized protein n=1 Tax=bioreactor metagenome TaxID=1076179 RepID=A0A645C465_9ZZZZ